MPACSTGSQPTRSPATASGPLAYGDGLKQSLRRPAHRGTASGAQFLYGAGAQFVVGGKQPLHRSVVVVSGVEQEREGAAKQRRHDQFLRPVDQKRLGDAENLALPSPHRDELPIAQEVAHAGRRNTQPFGEVGNGKPHGFVIHEPSVQTAGHRRCHVPELN